MKRKKSFMLQLRSLVDNQLIKKFYEDITNKHDPQIITNIMRKEESMQIIKTIFNPQLNQIYLIIINLIQIYLIIQNPKIQILKMN